MPLVIVKTIVALLGCLVVADVAGVLACTFFDVMPIRGSDSSALPYAIWFVFGVFCGLFAFHMSGGWAAPKHDAPDWSSLPQARGIGSIVLVTSAGVILVLCAFFYSLYWSRGVQGEYYVPDSAPHSVVFFLAVFGAIVLARYALMPDSGGSRH